MSTPAQSNLGGPSLPNAKAFAATAGSAAPEAEYCTTVAEAYDAGWERPYEGGTKATGYKGRIYGQKPGNHRVWRCTKRQIEKGQR